jgi:hypothetical protein
MITKERKKTDRAGKSRKADLKRLVARTCRITALPVLSRFGVILTYFKRERAAETGLLVDGSLTRGGVIE